MFTVPLDFLKQRVQSMPRIKTYQEKEALLVDSDKLSDFLKPLTDIVPINQQEAELFILYLREQSISDEFRFIVTCECGVQNELIVNIEELINLEIHNTVEINGINFDLPLGLFTRPESIINSQVLDTLSLSNYNKIQKSLNDQNKQILKLEVYKSCRRCQKSIEISIDPRENFSSSNLSGLYQDYINISTFTSNSKLDIDDLYPFEREIYNNLIAEKVKDD